ncbi:PDZ domain-containing protein 2 isoform X1 [Tachysurus ichikawai]
MGTEATSSESSFPLGMPTEESPVTGHSVAINNNISAATLPDRSDSCLSKSLKSQTGRNDPSSQIHSSASGCSCSSKVLHQKFYRFDLDPPYSFSKTRKFAFQ